MYAILHLPTATLVQRGTFHPYKRVPMSFSNKADADEFLTHAIIKNSNGTWEGVYWDSSGSGSLQHMVPEYRLEVIEVANV